MRCLCATGSVREQKKNEGTGVKMGRARRGDKAEQVREGMGGRVGEGGRGRERERSRSLRPPSSPQAAVAQALPHGPSDAQGVLFVRGLPGTGPYRSTTGEWQQAASSVPSRSSRTWQDHIADYVPEYWVERNSGIPGSAAGRPQ